MTEAQKRDEALDLLSRTRRELIDKAYGIAVDIARETGSVTSTEVLAKMTVPDGIDRRFMGPVFRRKCWRRVAWDDSGSHRRLVPRWILVPR